LMSERKVEKRRKLYDSNRDKWGPSSPTRLPRKKRMEPSERSPARIGRKSKGRSPVDSNFSAPGGILIAAASIPQGEKGKKKKKV